MVVVGKLLDSNARDLSVLAQRKYQTNEIALSVLSKIGVNSNSLSDATTKVTDVESSVYLELEKLDTKYYTTHYPPNVDPSSIKKQVYVFYDYECPYCAAALEQIEAAGLRAQFNWLPVAILGRSSATYGAGVLDGDVPIKQIANTKVLKHPQPTATSLEAVAHNTSLLKAMQKRAATPTFVYRAPSGNVSTLSGYDSSTNTALAQMLASE